MMARNGYLPNSELVTVQAGIQLSRPTANAWFAMAAEGSRSGHRVGVASPAGGYRSFDVQKDMKANPRKYGLNPKSLVPIAKAGSSSHGFGTRVDIVGDLTWAINNAHRWGFTREFGPADPNHFAHNGVTATGGTVAHTIDESEQDMKLIKHPNGQPAWIGEFTFIEIAASTMADLEPIYGPAVTVSADAYTFTSQRIGYNRAAIVAGSPDGGAAPTKEDIAAEVIRQMKLPGN